MLVLVRDVNMQSRTTIDLDRHRNKMTQEGFGSTGFCSQVEHDHRLAKLVIELEAVVTEDAGNNLEGVLNLVNKKSEAMLHNVAIVDLDTENKIVNETHSNARNLPTKVTITNSTRVAANNLRDQAIGCQLSTHLFHNDRQYEDENEVSERMPRPGAH